MNTQTLADPDAVIRGKAAISRPSKSPGRDDPRRHTVPVILAALIVLTTITLATLTSYGVFERQADPDKARLAAGAVQSDFRTLRFEDAPGGFIVVADGATGEELARYGIDEGGFVRSTARAVITGRLQAGIGQETPFELIEWSNGSMTLRDPETERSIELGSFGEQNRQIYLGIMKEGRE